MAARAFRTLLAAALVGGGVAALVAACTVFDGLESKVVSADAGTDAPDLPPGAQPGFLSVDEAVRFCSNVVKCPQLASSTIDSLGLFVDVYDFSACVDGLSAPLPSDRIGRDLTRQTLLCAANATSCQEAGSCLYYEIVPGNDSRCQSVDGGSACAENGAAAYNCDSQAIVHCQNAYFAPGSSCQTGTDGSHYCALATTCKPEGCNGTVLQYCASNSNLTIGYDCNLLGLTCGFDQANQIYDCLSNGASAQCSSTGVACDGASVKACDGAYASYLDCPAMGATCDAAHPRCARATDECSPYDANMNQCDGTSLTMCVGGKVIKYDCGSVGLTCKAGLGAGNVCG